MHNDDDNIIPGEVEGSFKVVGVNGSSRGYRIISKGLFHPLQFHSVAFIRDPQYNSQLVQQGLLLPSEFSLSSEGADDRSISF